MIKPFFRFIKNLIGYTLVATLLLSPVGWVLIGMLFFIRKNQWCLDTWLLIDKLACNICHRTGLNRTISGWTGQHIHLPRYKLQAKLIDWIFGKSHCIDQFKYESRRGWVRYEQNSTAKQLDIHR